jgi:hypothetical protein
MNEAHMLLRNGKHMKRILPLIFSLLFGIGIGWYFGYTRPVAKHQRELLKEYQDVKNEVHVTDEEMADMGRKIPQYFKDMKRQDEMAAAVALSALMKLEAGETDAAKLSLLQAVGSYYRLYHEQVGDKYPDIAAEISRKVE